MASSTSCVPDATFHFPTLHLVIPQQSPFSQIHNLPVRTPQRPHMRSRIPCMDVDTQAAHTQGHAHVPSHPSTTSPEISQPPLTVLFLILPHPWHPRPATGCWCAGRTRHWRASSSYTTSPPSGMMTVAPTPSTSKAESPRLRSRTSRLSTPMTVSI